MHNALVRLVVGVCEEDLPVAGQPGWVHCVAMVLGGDEAALRAGVDARLVVAPIAIPKIQEHMYLIPHVTLEPSPIINTEH